MTGFDERLFANRTVVVTGAGRGIGAAVATGFLRCGAQVIAHAGRDLSHVEGDLLARLPSGARANLKLLTGDLAAPDGGAELAREILSHASAIDVLVNNAGTMGGTHSDGQETREDYDHVLDLNIRSVVALTGTLLPALRRAERARPRSSTRSRSRAGRAGAPDRRSIRRQGLRLGLDEDARQGTGAGRHPGERRLAGTIMTDFHRRYSTKDKLDATAAAIPMKRLGTAEDCAPAYLFLAANTLSGYVTGQILEVNGGQLMP